MGRLGERINYRHKETNYITGMLKIKQFSIPHKTKSYVRKETAFSPPHLLPHYGKLLLTIQECKEGGGAILVLNILSKSISFTIKKHGGNGFKRWCFPHQIARYKMLKIVKQNAFLSVTWYL